MGRLFTFGCSFTNYMWPTWANIVAFDRQKELYNYGHAGLGNVGIMLRVLEADMKWNFTDDDEIMIMWSSWTRDDKVLQNTWQGNGSRFNHIAHIKQLGKTWSPEDDIIKNASAMIYVKKAYGNLITFQGNGFTPWIGEGATGIIDTALYKVFDNEKEVVKIKNFYQKHTPNIPTKSLDKVSTQAFDYVADCHPDIKGHLQIVEDFVYPNCNHVIELRQETKDTFNDIHEKLKQRLMKVGAKTLDKAQPYPAGIIQEFYPELEDLFTIRSLIDDMSG